MKELAECGCGGLLRAMRGLGDWGLGSEGVGGRQYSRHACSRFTGTYYSTIRYDTIPRVYGTGTHDYRTDFPVRKERLHWSILGRFDVPIALV